MSEPFKNPDALYRAIGLTSANRTIAWTESGGSTNTADLPLSIDGAYFNVATDDPSDAGLNSTAAIKTLNDLDVIPLLGHIARVMSDQSPNGRTYQIESATPSGSSLTNSGIKITSGGGEFTFDWSSTTLNPRYLGFRRGVTGTSQQSSSGELVSPNSIWGVWQSPIASFNKRKGLAETSFKSAKYAGAPQHAWERLDRVRPIFYRKVASPHVYAWNRADDSELADLAGLPLNDANNNLEDFWRLARGGTEQRILVHHGNGDQGIRWWPPTQTHEVVSLHKQPDYNPPKNWDKQWADEQYDIMLQVAAEPPAKYEYLDDLYRY